MVLSSWGDSITFNFQLDHSDVSVQAALAEALDSRMATTEGQLRAIKLKLGSSRVDGEEISA